MTDHLLDLTPQQRELLELRLARRQRQDDGTHALSHTQEQLWFLDRLDPGDPAYNVAFGLRLTGRLDPLSLRAALTSVMARHAALRTVFSEPAGDGGGPRQSVRPAAQVDLPVTDLRDEADPSAAADVVATEHALHHFDLTAAPPVLIRLVRVADEEHLLLVAAHHIVFDASSAEVFTADLVACYDRHAVGEPVDLAPLGAGFPEHAAAHRLSGAELAGHLAHWRARLAGAPELSTIPPDRPRPPVATHRGARVEVDLPAGELAEFARREGVSLNAVVLTAFAAVLRRFTGQDRVLLGMPVGGRAGAAQERMIGSFANMLVLDVPVAGDTVVRDLVRATHRRISEAHAHQDAPYARVVEELRPPRDPSRNPLFQAMISLTQAGAATHRAAGVTFSPAPVDNGRTDFDLFVTLTRDGDELHGVVGYNTDLYLTETITSAVAAFTEALADLPDAGGSTLDEVPALARGTVSVAATFTADPVLDPARFWCEFLRLPLDVELAPYGQVVQHLLGGATPRAQVVLLRWEDFLRHHEGRPAGPVLDAAFADLADAMLAFRTRSAAPLLVAVCPPSPDHRDAALLSRMDDRLAVLCHDIGAHACWPAAWAATYPVADRHDRHADRIAHVPYQPEYFAALGTVLARQLNRLLGGTAQRVVLDPSRAPLAARLAGDRLIPVTGDLVEFLAELQDRTGCLVIDPDEAVVAAVRARYPDTPAAGTAALGHLWPLDPPADRPDRPFLLGGERTAAIAEQLTSAAAVAERATPARRPASTVDDLVAPRTDLEARLARLWADVLDLPEVGVTTDFFAIGGHSLLATQLLSRVHTELGRKVTLYTLFTHPTVEALATELDEDGGPDWTPLARVPRDTELVPSSTQQRLWALAQLGEDTARHNTVVAAVLRGRLDPAALRAALADVVARHEILRTTFVERAGRPVMVIAKDAGDHWLPDLDLADEPDRDRTIALRTALRRHARHPFDLATGPLLVARLIRTGDTEHHLLLGMHHIVCDNSSWAILLDELAAHYAGRDLPTPSVQFADHAAWQHDQLAGDELVPHVEYWRARLAGAPPLVDLPTDHPRPDTASDRAGRSRDTVPAGRVEALRELCRAEGLTPFAALLAAFGVLLARRAGQTDVVVGVPSAGRSRPESQQLIGCFTDLLPFRLDLSGRPSFRVLARRVHRTVTEAYQHADVPFATIVDALRLPRDPRHHPVFQSVFNVAELAPPAFADLDVELLDVPTSGIDFDLFLTLSWEGEEMDALLEYRADLFTSDGAGTLLTEYLGVLDTLLDDPDREVDGAAGAAGSRAEANTITVASTTGVDDVAVDLAFWSAAVGLDAEVTLVEPGQVLSPLLDPYGPFRRGTDLAVLLVRLTDLLPGLDPTAEESVAPAVVALERWLPELAAAIRSAGRPVLLGVLPGAPAGDRLTAVLTHVTERLRRFATTGANVEFLDLADADPGTAIARAAARHWCPPVHTVLFGPNLAAQRRPMWTQRSYGRTVATLAEAPPADPAGCAVIDPDPAVLASFVDRHPGVLAIQADAVDGLWLLDGPQPAGPGILARPDGELLARIASGLVTPETVGGGEPRTERERTLARVFAELLKVDRVGVHDNFFELGGDSMSAIRAVSAAAAAGIAITPRQLVATPTVAQLCTATTAEQPTAEQGTVTGGMPLTSAQAWFFDALAPTMTTPSHFNHPYYLELRRPVAAEHLRAAVTELATHHDALRLRFPRAGWAEHAAPEGAVRFDSHDLSEVPAADREAVMTDLATRAQAGLDLAAGPILRAVHFGLGGGAPDRLLVVVHHLVVDGVSRNLLLTDLAALCRALAAGEAPVLPAKTTSYRDWANRLHEYARSDALLAELPFWVEQTDGPRAELPVDVPGARTTFGTLESVATTLDAAETTALHEMCRRLRIGVGDALTWAAVRLAANWTGCPEWTVGTTGHGREALFDDVDTARTIGWFQVLYPIRLRLPDGPAKAGLTAVATTLRTVPHNGIGYGLLRYSCPDPDVRARLATAMPQLVVNYMGAFGFADVGPGADLFDVCDKPFGLPQDAGGEWHSRLDVVGALVGDELRVELNYGTEVHREETVRARLADLRTLLTDLAR